MKKEQSAIKKTPVDLSTTTLALLEQRVKQKSNGTDLANLTIYINGKKHLAIVVTGSYKTNKNGFCADVVVEKGTSKLIGIIKEGIVYIVDKVEKEKEKEKKQNKKKKKTKKKDKKGKKKNKREESTKKKVLENITS